MSAIALPREMATGSLGLEEAIEQRRSVRDYADRSLTLAQLSRLLHCASGLTDPGAGRRAAPSAGALYPLEAYVVATRVQGLALGLYRYRTEGHALDSRREGDLRRELQRSCLGQDTVARAGAVAILAAVFERTRAKYAERAYRYVLLEAGHIAQNLYLAATSLGLGACSVGAFDDGALNALLGIDGETEAAVYVVAVGCTQANGG